MPVTRVCKLAFLFIVCSSLFWAISGLTPALALSSDSNQAFCDSPIEHWTVSCGGCGTTISYGLENYIADSSTEPVSIPEDPNAVTNVYDCPTSMGAVTTAGTCSTCSVTVTYTDPSPTGVPTGSSYIEVDVYTYAVVDDFYLIVTDTNGDSVTALTNDIIVNCNSPPATIQGSTHANQWDTLFISLAGLSLTAPVSTVSVIIPAGQASLEDGDPIFLDNLQMATSLPCVVSPTPTFTYTPTNTYTSTPTGTPTNTSTATFTFTQTFTPTPTFTSTDTSTPTNTSTSTDTFTPTNSPTPTSPNTPTSTGTPTFTPIPTSTFTTTATATNTGTPPPTSTSTNTGTPTFTFTPTSTFTVTTTFTNTGTSTPTSTSTHTFTPSLTFTPTFTSTFTNTPTITFTFTSTFTPTITNTPGPTATFTPTCEYGGVYPDPMDFQHNPPYNNIQDPKGTCSGPCLKFGCVPVGATLKIYTVSLGGLVRQFLPGDPNFHLSSTNLSVGTITWDGTNGDGNDVASGIYLYVIQGPNGNTFGKFAISRSGNGS